MSDKPSVVKKITPASHLQGDKILEDIHELYMLTHKILDKQHVNDCRQQQEYRDLRDRLTRIEQLLEKTSYGVTQIKRNQQIIISMTSYGKRVYTLPIVLERLFNQTVKPDRIILYLSKENFPEGMESLPLRLLDMQMFGLEIKWLDGDIRSYKKLVPAMIEFPEDVIITVDDDIYYDLDMVENLIESYRMHPNSIIAYRAHLMKFKEDGAPASYSEWESQYNEAIDEERDDLFPTTGGGTLFPPHCFHEDATNADKFMELAPTADDVWFKVMAKLAGTKVVVPKVQKGIKLVDGTQEESLWSVNENANDEMIAKLTSEYNIQWK